MRVTVLTTSGNNTIPLYEPLFRLGHVLTVFVYDKMAWGCPELPALVHSSMPDWVLYIGALEISHGLPVPPIEVLSEIGKRWKLVHLCCDGAEPAWWPQLVDYYDADCFALQVTIDGVNTGPIGERGLVLLPPIDPYQYPTPKPLGARPHLLGFAGYAHYGERVTLVHELTQSGIFTSRPRSETDDGTGYREFLGNCSCIFNHPATGGSTRVHVKARCLEAALAGSLLLEKTGSPLQHWFTAGTDYLTYTNATDIVDKALWSAFGETERAQQVANNLRTKVIAEHNPKIFWDNVLAWTGLGNPLRYEWKLPSIPWSITSDTEPRLVGNNLIQYDGGVFNPL